MSREGFSTRGFPCRTRAGRIPRRLKKRFKVEDVDAWTNEGGAL